MKNFNFELFNFVDKYWQTNEKTKTFVNPVDQFLSRKSLKTIPSTSNGVVKEILVEDGQPVEFGQVLIILE